MVDGKDRGAGAVVGKSVGAGVLMLRRLLDLVVVGGVLVRSCLGEASGSVRGTFGDEGMLVRNVVVLGKVEGMRLMWWNFEGLVVLVVGRRL